MKSLFLISFFILLVVALVCPSLLFAQDSTIVGLTPPVALPAWTGLAVKIAFGIYEVLVRYIPTSKNYSLIGWAFKVFQAIVPNNNSVTPTQPHS